MARPPMRGHRTCCACMLMTPEDAPSNRLKALSLTCIAPRSIELTPLRSPHNNNSYVCCSMTAVDSKVDGDGVTWLEALKALEATPQSAPRTSTSGSSNMLCSSYSGTRNAGDAPRPA